MANANGLGRLCQFGGRQAVDPVIGVLGDLRAGVRDAGQMDHRLDPLEQRAPFDRTGQVGDRHHLDVAREYIRRLPHRRAHGISEPRQLRDQRASDEARCAGDENVRHDLPREKRYSSQPTSAPPPPSAATVLSGPGHSTLAAASATSARFTANTWAMISGTLKPRSVASW